MCDFEHHEPLPPLSEDEYILDTGRVREFIRTVRARVQRADSPAHACNRISPLFAELLADPEWLPASYQAPAPNRAWGGIGQWLIFRAADRSLSLFSLVVPAGAMTPVHDHLACGPRRHLSRKPGRGVLSARRRSARARAAASSQPWRLLTLLPPRDDVHRVRTTSLQTSVSIHLLANDTGCVWRHTYDEGTGAPSPFRSGYVNAECL